MNKKHSTLWMLFLLSIMSMPYTGFTNEKQQEVGKKMYGKLCYKCHDYGQRGAPKLGYKSDWATRVLIGREALITSVMQGKGFMLATGGGGSATREQMGTLVDYMLSTLKDDAYDYTPVRRIAESLELYSATCFSCHNTGINHTPRLGDKNAWQTRAKKGLPSLVKNVIEGHGKIITGAVTMSATGTVGTIAKPKSKEEIESMVRYMLSTVDP